MEFCLRTGGLGGSGGALAEQAGAAGLLHPESEELGGGDAALIDEYCDGAAVSLRPRVDDKVHTVLAGIHGSQGTLFVDEPAGDARGQGA